MIGLAGASALAALILLVTVSGESRDRDQSAVSIASAGDEAGYEYAAPTSIAVRPAGLSRLSEVQFDHDGLCDAVDQWPASPQEQLRAMDARLTHVTDAVNAAAGTQCVVMLGRTQAVAEAKGNSIILLDTMMLYKLSENALAALLAHEIAHEVLGHHERLTELEEGADRPDRRQQIQNIELAADTLAGRLLARTTYKPTGFAELLRHARSTRWEPPQQRRYYPHERRWTVFQQAYLGEMPLGVAEASASPRGGSSSQPAS